MQLLTVVFRDVLVQASQNNNVASGLIKLTALKSPLCKVSYGLEKNMDEGDG
jgi:hypothetical protein